MLVELGQAKCSEAERSRGICRDRRTGHDGHNGLSSHSLPRVHFRRHKLTDTWRRGRINRVWCRKFRSFGLSTRSEPHSIALVSTRALLVISGRYQVMSGLWIKQDRAPSGRDVSGLISSTRIHLRNFFSISIFVEGDACLCVPLGVCDEGGRSWSVSLRWRS